MQSTTENILEQFKVNQLYQNYVPLSRRATIRTFAEEFVTSPEISSEYKSQYLYQSILANVCFQSALVRADLSRLILLADFTVYVRDAITTYLTQQNSLNRWKRLQALQKPDDNLLFLFECVMSLVPMLKLAGPVVTDSAVFFLQEEEDTTQELEKLEETFILLDAFESYVIPAAMEYMEKFYPDKLTAYLDSY